MANLNIPSNHRSCPGHKQKQMHEMCILRELEDCNASPILSLLTKINLTENAAGQ
jgi:hypothetical protein